MSLKIVIGTTPHKNQRYPTVGDWIWITPDVLEIQVSDMGNWRYEALVAVHELVEVLLCKQRGITQEVVDGYDVGYENKRPEGDLSEPGDSADAPYRNEHFFATNVERLLAAELGVDWREYGDVVESL